jgi:hypothetical protein
LVGNELCLALFRKVKHGCKTNKEMLMFSKSKRSNSLRVSMRFIVAIRLQAQHSSFRLHTSSNTTSVLTNNAHGSLRILIRNCTFHLATFALRSAWTNWHNSRQCCHLDELMNQSELTRDLASTQETRHGLNRMKDHVQEWKDLKAHEKVTT